MLPKPIDRTGQPEAVAMIREWHELVQKAYSLSLGRSRGDLATPALILDLDLARSNLRIMAEKMAGLHAGLRPHIKVHKCGELALMQIEAGAIGGCTATVWEAIVMSRAGIENVLIANQVGGSDKIRGPGGDAGRGGYPPLPHRPSPASSGIGTLEQRL